MAKMFLNKKLCKRIEKEMDLVAAPKTETEKKKKWVNGHLFIKH